MTREMGKPLQETRGDVQEGIDTAYYAATEGRRLFGHTKRFDGITLTVPEDLRSGVWRFGGGAPTVLRSELGAGSIGSHVASIARGFEMITLAVDVRPDPRLAQEYNVHYVTLGDLLGESDIITLHIPLLPATRGLLGREAFARMKKGCFIVNCARGGIIDEADLARALDEELIAEMRKELPEGIACVFISSITQQGITELKDLIWKNLH